MAFPVTAVFAGLLAVWLMFLQFKVVQQRRSKRIVLGDGGDADCERVIRAHGNAVETVPIFLILLAASESLGAPVWVLGALGALFTVGRVMHGVHFVANHQKLTFRFWGMLITLIATGLAALGAIAHGLGHLMG